MALRRAAAAGAGAGAATGAAAGAATGVAAAEGAVLVVISGRCAHKLLSLSMTAVSSKGIAAHSLLGGKPRRLAAPMSHLGSSDCVSFGVSISISFAGSGGVSGFGAVTFRFLYL